MQKEKGKVKVLAQPWSEDEKIPDMDQMRKAVRGMFPSDEIEMDIEVVDSLILSKSGKQIHVATSFTPWEE